MSHPTSAAAASHLAMRSPSRACLRGAAKLLSDVQDIAQDLPFALPSVVSVAYDVLTAEQALREHGFVPNENHRVPALVGFDVETRPSFSKGKVNRNAPALVQLSNERACVLVHLASMRGDAPPTLRALCEDEATLFVGNGVLNDMRDLDRTFQFESKGFVDTGVVALAYGVKKHGLKASSARYGYDADKPKSVQMSNWERAPLERKQIDYGAIDAALGLWVLKRMHQEYATGGTTLLEWATAFANATSPGEVRRRAQKQHGTPECVKNALDIYDANIKAESTEHLLAKKAKKAAVIVGRVFEGKMDPVSAATSLSAIFTPPKTADKTKRAEPVMQWIAGERNAASSAFGVQLKLGSTMRGMGEGRNIKAAKFQAAKSVFDELVQGKAQDDEYVDRWIQRELKYLYARNESL